MYNLIRFYNQNRRKIIEIILIIVFIILIIQLLNYFSKKENNNNENNNIIIKSNYDQEVISDKSAISGSKISGNKLNEDTDVIKSFYEYCNQGNIESAYNLLTDECKEEMFSNIDDFKEIYYNYLFNGEKKSYTIENWIGDTYVVRITGDILSTGKLDNTETRQDYVTIANNNKLNINSYIGRRQPDKKTQVTNDINITVKQVDTYMDYEIYSLYIENDSSNAILLDTSDDTKSVYLLDENKKKSYFYNNEINQSKLLVQSKFKINLKVKFSNSYSSSRKIKSIIFSKCILNYDEYKKLEDKTQFNDFSELKINL